MERRRGEYWAGLGAVFVVVAVGVLQLWPVPHRVGGSATELLLGDPVLVGILRIGILVTALYGIASVPALIIGGRWANALSTSGIVAEDRADATRTLEDALRRLEVLETHNAHLTEEREALWELVELETRPE